MTMKKKISFFFLLVLVFLFSASQVSAFIFPRNQKRIVVFRQDFFPEKQRELLDRLKITPNKSLRLINAQAVVLSAKEENSLLRDPQVLRIDPDVEVYALPRANQYNWCDRFPWLPWCPKPTPTPSPSLTPTPTQLPTQTPTPTSSPTPTMTPPPTPTNTPTPKPTATPTSIPTPTPTPGGGNQMIPWGVDRVEAPTAWDYSTGEGVKVAILDSGVDIDHPDLDDNLAGCENFIYRWQNCDDDNGHGTHVAGIIAAEDNNFGVAGVAPKARIDALKVLNSRGRGYLSDVLEALDWAIANNAQVINMSLGTSSDITSFREAIEKVHAAGITQVSSAGNSGPAADSVTYPARYPEVIAVAATDVNNNVPSWSSRGEIDLAAPGVEIYSTYRGGGYRNMSGTSMSAPHVTGVVALRLFLHPSETPAEVEVVLKDNATPLFLDPSWAGAGLVNAYDTVIAP